METENLVPEQRFALGLGLTNECNLACSFCYWDPERTDRISLEQVQRVVAALPVHSVNLGTGENGMHPEFHRIIGWLKDQPLRMTMTSNGHSVDLLTDEELAFFSDIEFSLDYDNRAQQDGQRGAGNWELIHRQAARCVTTSTPRALLRVLWGSSTRAPRTASSMVSSNVARLPNAVRRSDARPGRVMAWRVVLASTARLACRNAACF